MNVLFALVENTVTWQVVIMIRVLVNKDFTVRMDRRVPRKYFAPRVDTAQREVQHPSYVQEGHSVTTRSYGKRTNAPTVPKDLFVWKMGLQHQVAHAVKVITARPDQKSIIRLIVRLDCIVLQVSLSCILI